MLELCSCGYDNAFSLKCLDKNNFNELEKSINENRETVLDFTTNCSHKNVYDMQKTFAFLVGHRTMILKWCSEIQSDVRPIDTSSNFVLNHPAFSPILREIILVAASNYDKPSNRRRFSKLLMDFSMYIYIFAGKACYEILCANLSLPAAGTICGYYNNYAFVSNYFQINQLL